MPKNDLIRRYLIFAAGLFCNALGVALVTKAALGNTPMSAIPYSLSLILPALTLGWWTILYNIFLTMLQWLLLRRSANKPELLLQVVISFCFGYCIDLCMLCLTWLAPESYLLRLLTLLIGCVVIAYGAFLEVRADVVMLPGDGLARAFSKVTGKEFGSIRVISDIIMSSAAAVLCLIFLRSLAGVREGTVIAAVLVGNLVKLFKKIRK
ncbi:MAG: YitT family protein [Clostridia bacterium]|nr:YitT family protein [Clostridia bacterium]